MGKHGQDKTEEKEKLVGTGDKFAEIAQEAGTGAPVVLARGKRLWKHPDVGRITPWYDLIVQSASSVCVATRINK